MPAMDLALIQSLGRELHSHSPGFIGEDEVCPWTLFLTMALTLLKGKYICHIYFFNIFLKIFFFISTDSFASCISSDLLSFKKSGRFAAFLLSSP